MPRRSRAQIKQAALERGDVVKRQPRKINLGEPLKPLVSSREARRVAMSLIKVRLSRRPRQTSEEEGYYNPEDLAELSSRIEAGALTNEDLAALASIAGEVERGVLNIEEYPQNVREYVLK